ncbi:MAG: hypothetical protein HND44_05390 [Chloroflexi bacterium]|nr:hypothetical protein [Ardenticatenaceae bacterium]NOG33997.1 hypothetical protein [Chloroflexota bacterium]
MIEVLFELPCARRFPSKSVPESGKSSSHLWTKTRLTQSRHIFDGDNMGDSPPT